MSDCGGRDRKLVRCLSSGQPQYIKPLETLVQHLVYLTTCSVSPTLRWKFRSEVNEPTVTMSNAGSGTAADVQDAPATPVFSQDPRSRLTRCTCAKSLVR